MCRKIVVTSGKGGVGKTTIVATLGMVLAKMGYKTMIIDMDFGLNNLDILTGIENKIVYDIIDVIENKCSPRQALVQHFLENNLYVFPSTHGFCSVKFGSKELISIIKELDKYFDYILIDCPAGIDGGFRRSVECADEHIVITTPHLSSVRDASKVINILNMTNKFKPYLLINRARGDLMLDGQMLDVESITKFLNVDLLGVVPEGDEVIKQMIDGNDIDNDCDIYRSVTMIANNIVMDERKIFDCQKKYRGFFGKIRKKIKKVI